MELVKRGGGRKKSTGLVYAIELGIPYRKLVRLGGEDRLRAMSADARAILLKPGCVRAVVAQAERVA